MSSINTNGINVNYPVPGVNNNSQGFRDNFASIKTNLDTASSEITDLQNKVVVKQALNGTTLNNDMANTLISNASTRSFRATMYNLGGSLSGIVNVNASLGDVQYGTVASNSNVTLTFGNWAPSGTQSNIQLMFNFNDNNSYVIFPSSATFSNNTGVATIENSTNSGGNLVISAPANTTQLTFQISTTDCGNTLYVTPINRPRQSTQIQTVTTISPVGFPGDTSGAVSMGPSYNQLIITGANTDPFLTTSGNTTQLYTDMPIVFTGTSLAGSIVVGTTYYVKTIVSNTKFTISSTLGGSNIAIGANATGTSMFANPVSSVYFCTDNYDATAYSSLNITATATSGNITIGTGGGSLANNIPIIFSGNMGGLIANKVYYVKSFSGTGSGSNIKVSLSRTNGVADTAVTLTANTTAVTATYYVGSDIWKKINLTSW